MWHAWVLGIIGTFAALAGLVATWKGAGGRRAGANRRLSRQAPGSAPARRSVYHRTVTLAAVTLALSLATAGDSLLLDAPPEPSSWRVPVAHAAGVLAGMRIAVGLAWPSSYDPSRFADEGRQLRLAYTQPPEFQRGRGLLASDGDPTWINAVAHGLFGSEVYARTRQCGHGALAAFLTTAAASVVWEYGLEAPYKRPSAIDLVWTPLVGGAIGEGRFRLHRWLRARNSSPWLLFVVDPFGEAERRVLGTGC